MHLIEFTPSPCLSCGAGNANDRAGERRQFVDLERDINWNDPAILCEDCIMKLGALIGMMGEDARLSLEAEVKKAHRETHAAQAALDAMRQRARRLGVTLSEVPIKKKKTSKTKVKKAA